MKRFVYSFLQVPTKLPSPEPAKRSKAFLLEGPHMFDDVDFYAVQAAQREQVSFTALMFELARPCKTPLQKIRLLQLHLKLKHCLLSS